MRMSSGLAVVVATIAWALPAVAGFPEDECNALVAIGTLSGDDFAIPGGPGVGSVYRRQVRIGTESIEPPGPLTIERLRFALDCQNVALIDFCMDEGDVVRWVGNEEIETGCVDASSNPVAMSCDGLDSPDGPNVVICQFSAPIVLDPFTQPANGCILSFDVRLQNRGSDATPDIVTAAVGFSSQPIDGRFDADCFNDDGPATISHPTTIAICPDCDDGDACTTDSCDPDTALCANVEDVEPTCSDQDACTRDFCDPLVGCVSEFDSSIPGCAALPVVPPFGIVLFGGMLLGAVCSLVAARHPG